MAASAAAVPLAAPAFDLENGANRQSKEEPAEGISIYYYIVYGFSVFILVLGAWAWLLPFSESSIVGTVLGAGGLVTGLFLILNTDLLVTWMRLTVEMRKFKANNEKYKANLVVQGKKVKKLKEAEKALKRFDGFCNGSLENFTDELGELVSTSRDNTRRNIVGLLTVVRPKQEDVQAGESLDSLVRMFECMYVRAFPDIEKRIAEMYKGLEGSPRWKEVQSLSVDRLKFILASVLFEDLKDVRDNVTAKIQAATTGDFAGGWEQIASASSYDPSWVDAEAFAAGQKAPAVQKKDSWADAMDFAGVDR